MLDKSITKIYSNNSENRKRLKLVQPRRNIMKCHVRIGNILWVYYYIVYSILVHKQSKKRYLQKYMLYKLTFILYIFWSVGIDYILIIF